MMDQTKTEDIICARSYHIGSRRDGEKSCASPRICKNALPLPRSGSSSSNLTSQTIYECTTSNSKVQTLTIISHETPKTSTPVTTPILDSITPSSLEELSALLLHVSPSFSVESISRALTAISFAVSSVCSHRHCHR
mmetsp:Transcript_12146/g.21957  ORF Transcript_12146/g.21957 Transcript_12146/m.21957 type:complete len:137 (-) Transcript_12146:567-977(-)